MEPQLITCINHPPPSRLGTPLLKAETSEGNKQCNSLAVEHNPNANIDDFDAVLGEPVWTSETSDNGGTSAAAALQFLAGDSVVDTPVSSKLSDIESASVPAAQKQSSLLEIQPSSTTALKIRTSRLSESSSESPFAGGTLRMRMQQNVATEDDSDEDGDHVLVRKAAALQVQKKGDLLAVGKYKVAIESDSDGSDIERDAMSAEHFDEYSEIESALKKTLPLAAARGEATQRATDSEAVVAAHAEDCWKPINVWSRATPLPAYTRREDNSVLLSAEDLQLLQKALSPQNRKSRGVHAAPEQPAAGRMAMLPPERCRKWPSNNLFSIKAERKALSGLKLNADDAEHLQDIENCILQGGQITDELRDVKSKLRKLQQQPARSTPFTSRATTQLKSSHTLAASELRVMTGDAPSRNPFLPADYGSGRSAYTAAGAVLPYDSIRLLQSYDSESGTVQRLHEHERLMSDL
jgi:hypothetical protein